MPWPGSTGGLGRNDSPEPPNLWRAQDEVRQLPCTFHDVEFLSHEGLALFGQLKGQGGIAVHGFKLIG